MSKLNIKTSKKVVPMCYAYTTPQIKDHDGWTKIGLPSKMLILAFASKLKPQI